MSSPCFGLRENIVLIFSEHNNWLPEFYPVPKSCRIQKQNSGLITPLLNGGGMRKARSGNPERAFLINLHETLYDFNASG